MHAHWGDCGGAEGADVGTQGDRHPPPPLEKIFALLLNMHTPRSPWVYRYVHAPVTYLSCVPLENFLKGTLILLHSHVFMLVLGERGEGGEGERLL